MRLLLILTLSILWTELAYTADFSTLEQQELLNYTRSCLISILEGTPAPPPTSSCLQKQKACFVTFFHNRSVIACFGSFTPRRETLGEEIIDNIRLAIRNDPRASIITTQLANIADIQITFPQKPQRIKDWQSLNPLKEGLLVEAADGRGVAIVPGEARTAGYAWRSAIKRLNINPGNPGIRTFRFQAEVIRQRKRS